MRRRAGRRLGLIGTAALAVALLAGGAVATAALLKGTAGPDTIHGTSRGDRIAGRGGNDNLTGRGGHDRINGGSGRDRILGGAQQDTLHGGAGGDRLRGGPGGDALFGGRGRDHFNTRNGVVLGSPGNDVIHARDFNADEIDCGDGFDKVYVDGVEDGVYDCEKVISPDGEIGHAAPPAGDSGSGG